MCIRNLDDMDWQVAKLESDNGSKDDDLGKIANASKDLTSDVKKLMSLIHGNSSLLFRRASDQSINDKLDSDQPVSDKLDIPHDHTSGKPPMPGRPSLPPKPGTVQGRPLPALPLKDRPLPATPHSEGKRISGDFTRNAGDLNRISEEFKRLSMELKDQSNAGKKISRNLVDEYDYVHLEARELELQKRNKEQNSSDIDNTPVRDSQLAPSSDSDTLTRNNNSGAGDSEELLSGTHALPPSDKQVLHYYSEQLATHTCLLNNSIDAFFTCMACDQKPKDFISHSKFVVISAHKLVYVADSLSKNLTNNEVKTRVMQCANHLCNALKLTVTTTKTAALQYPSVPASQDMVDRIADVSHISHELKLVVAQAALM